MIGDETPRAIEALLLAAPVTHQYGAARIGIDQPQDAHRFQHGDRAGAVVRGAGSAVPRVEVRREHHVLVGELTALDFADALEHGYLAERLGIGSDFDNGHLLVLGRR